MQPQKDIPHWAADQLIWHANSIILVSSHSSTVFSSHWYDLLARGMGHLDISCNMMVH